MAIAPPITIDAPPVERLQGGLFAAANFPDLPVVDDNPNRWEAGIQYESEMCANPSTWAETCPGDVEPRLDKNPTLEFPLVEGTPFVAYLGVQCALPGKTLEEYERRVRNALAACEQRAVERTYWTGDMGNETHLADPSAVVVGGGTVLAPLSIVRGIAALESALGDQYCGVGVIHAPRSVAPYAADKQLIQGPLSRMTTPLGTRWAFGSGYSVNTGPDGAPAPSGVGWMYATGQVNIWRSEMWLQPDQLEQAFNTRTNDVLMLAERKYVITHECVLFAVPVNLSCDC